MTREMLTFRGDGGTMVVLSGTKYAINRYKENLEADWRFHGDYFGRGIYRADRDGRPRALYRAQIRRDCPYDPDTYVRILYAVGSSLREVKEAVKATLKEEGL